MSWESDLLRGIGGFLNTAGVGTYSEATAYTADQTAIMLGPLQPEPDRQIALTLYSSVDTFMPTQHHSTVRVQFYLRGNVGQPLDPAELADDIFNVLHGLTGVQMGNIWVVQAYRKVVSWQGIDTSNRAERADSYEFTVNWAPTTAHP